MGTINSCLKDNTSVNNSELNNSELNNSELNNENILQDNTNGVNYELHNENKKISCENILNENEYSNNSILPYDKKYKNEILEKDILSKYSLKYKLCSGNFGQIYKYKNILTSEEVIIKISDIFLNFKNEVNALLKLNHPNIINIIEYSSLNIKKDRYFIVEEYARKGDLYNLIKKNRLGESITKYIINSVLDALIYAYDVCDISHRDIKLENILIMNDGNIKLADWGLSSFNVKNRKCSSKCGTQSYMAPEVLLDNTYDSNKSDVWSLGIVLFILSSSLRPYNDYEDIEDLFNDYYYKIICQKKWGIFWDEHQDLIHLNVFSKNVCHLIEKILESNPLKRYSLKQMKNHIWFKNIISSKNDLLRFIENQKNNTLPGIKKWIYVGDSDY